MTVSEKFPQVPPPLYTNRLNANTVAGYSDSYFMQIPRSSLATRNGASSLPDQWAESFANSAVLRLEGRLLHPLTSQPHVQASLSLLKPGDQILGGLFTVKDRTSNSIIFAWSIPSWAVGFFDKVVQWGSPWKLPLGGLHELAVEDGKNAEEDMVKICFSYL